MILIARTRTDSVFGIGIAIAVALTFYIVAQTVFASRQKRRLEVAQAIRKEIVRAVLRDHPDLMSCMTDEGGDTLARFRQLQISPVDLNHDGKPEYYVGGEGNCACGAHNCSMWFYQKGGGQLNLILEGLGYSYTTKRRAGDPYDMVSISSHDSASTIYRDNYFYDKNKYRNAGSDFVNLDTGEAKPAQRRVAFQRGKSSAEVSGTVPVGFPDTYVLTARAGQTMAVKILSDPQAVSFYIIDGKTGSVTKGLTKSWSGPLPDDDEYRIIVEGDKGGSYRLSISVD